MAVRSPLEQRPATPLSSQLRGKLQLTLFLASKSRTEQRPSPQRGGPAAIVLPAAALTTAEQRAARMGHGGAAPVALASVSPLRRRSGGGSSSSGGNSGNSAGLRRSHSDPGLAFSQQLLQEPPPPELAPPDGRPGAAAPSRGSPPAAPMPNPSPCIRRQTSVNASPCLSTSCGVCSSAIRISCLETFSCGVHAFCSDCVTQGARLAVRESRLPVCFHGDCKAGLDPLVAMRLLSEGDYERYLQLALWSNPHVEACPRCRALLYSSSAAPCGHARCPSCRHSFCTECRRPAHRGVDCEEAFELEQDRRAQATGAQDMADEEDAQGQLALDCGGKCCPRCRAVIMKADEDSCDHMTCAQCRHEFCWSCLADRSVIYAHGCHHHRSSCRFFAPYAGPDEYLPERCTRCAVRGTACRAPRGGASVATQCYTSLVDACVQWLRDALRSGSCNMLE